MQKKKEGGAACKIPRGLRPLVREKDKFKGRRRSEGKGGKKRAQRAPSEGTYLKK